MEVKKKNFSIFWKDGKRENLCWRTFLTGISIRLCAKQKLLDAQHAQNKEEGVNHNQWSSSK